MTFYFKIGLITALTLTTSACSATGGMTNALAQKAASTAVSSAVSRKTTSTEQYVEPQAVAVAAKPSDAKMSCEAITTKVAELDAVIVHNGRIANKDISMASRQAATAAVAQGAVSMGLKTGMAKAVPFMNMFGQQAAERSANAKEKKVKKARKAYHSAVSRRATLMGVYAGKGC